ncbi:MAG: 4Fe-4S dicluster domain-containing protein [Deltaproteobacteria bacterium]|nr:4Fe-4S dicluster domain-containing protein [Deltaproteobacteria bacterium]
MLSKSYFGPGKTEFFYERASSEGVQPVAASLPEMATLLVPAELSASFAKAINVGETVKTGQRLVWGDQTGEAIISPVTGVISTVSGYDGDCGRKYIAISIKVEKDDMWDDQFANAAGEPNLQTLVDYLSSAPGSPALERLTDPAHPIHTIVIYGGDSDLLLDTSLCVLDRGIDFVEKGIRLLRKVSGVEKVFIAVPGFSLQNEDGGFPAEVKTISNQYPMGQPLMLLRNLFGCNLEQGQSAEDAGVLFLRSEAVASVGKAFTEARVPVDKIITVVYKGDRKKIVSARIGTPVGHILRMLDISVDERDRIFFGGPMTGMAFYSEDQPIQPDTDTIIVQDHNTFIFSSENKCLNCEECVRICPADIPVNILLRFLQSGDYQKASDLYDLYSCVECGQCYYVCTSAIPILKYIRQAKRELERATSGSGC